MSLLSYWSRRKFIGTAASAAAARRWSDAFAQTALKAPRSAASSPEEVTGGIRPLLKSNTARSLRYTPDGGDFLIRNGKEFFNRPLYGPNNAFRVDAGDLPEFSLYLPGHGGNLRLGVFASGAAKWLFQAAQIATRYRPGRMFYEIGDPLLGSGALELELFTAGEGSGLHLRVQARNVPSGLSLCWAFGGVSGRKGKRGGDIGCESEPVSKFFQLRPDECNNNSYEIIPPSASNNSSENYASATLHSRTADLHLLFPSGSDLRIADASAWDSGWDELRRSSGTTAALSLPALPLLIGSVALNANAPLHIDIQRVGNGSVPKRPDDLSAGFAARSAQIAAIAATLEVSTPDPCIDASAGALAIAADAIWDAKAQCVMHGGVAWRVPLAGWRGPYVLNALGSDERLRQHVRHWIARQNVSPLASAKSPATGVPDPGSHLSRKENLLHSRGDLSHNHYDMNLVFFDVLLRYLRWTGDLEFAREVWPALLLHLEWERRLFRRMYTTEGVEQVPLYEAYACIWASDNLEYNGGGATHSSAYNYYANKSAAELARLLGEDPTLFEREAALVHRGMQELLWLPGQGAFAESKDILAPQSVYTSPALWTVYHTIDSDVPSPRQAWQMAAERLAALKHVPVHGDGVPDGDWFLLSCSDWMPYIWSLNLLVLAENMHMALALWQAGLFSEAFRLFKGNLLDSMFQGLCPGNFHMTSQLDVHRQEAQRDFGDPIGITARALVEGLFGVKPDLLNGVLTIRPGFPSDWDRASLRHPNADIEWRREGIHESFEITPRFARPASLSLLVRAPRTGEPSATVNGVAVRSRFDPEAVGAPVLEVQAPPGPHWKIEVRWQGEPAPPMQDHRNYVLGDTIALPEGVHFSQIDDPQHCLRDGRVASTGFHTVFISMRQEDCRWWMPVSFEAKSRTPQAPSIRRFASGSKAEPLDLSAILRHRITDIFRRSYAAPRSPFCSLEIPEQGAGGWAAFDTQPIIDDAGLRSSKGQLPTPIGVPFRTPSNRTENNCLFLSRWRQDAPAISLPLSGNAESIFLLLAGTTFPQASRMVHGAITVHYQDGTSSEVMLRNPDNWWPIEQDYLLDDYLFVDDAPIPPRVDLRTGAVRLLDSTAFCGKGRQIPGGAANILDLTLDPAKSLVSLQIEASLHGIVIALLGVTLLRASAATG